MDSGKELAVKRFFWIFLLLLLSGCVPTPEYESVMNRADGVLEEKLAASPAVVPVSVWAQDESVESGAAPESAPAATPFSIAEPFPDRWEEEAALRPGLTLSIRADVVQPEAPVYPVLRTEPIGITPAWAQTILETVLPAPVSVAPDEMTKEDWTREFRAFMAEADASQGGDRDLISLSQEEIDAEAAFYMERIAEAPERNEPRPVSDYRDLTLSASYIYTLASGEQAYVSVNDSFLSVCRDCCDVPYLLYETQYASDRVWNRELDRLWKPVTLEWEKAEQTALAALNSLGFSDFAIAEAHPANLMQGRGAHQSVGQGWGFVFLRDCGYPLLRRFTATSFLTYDETENTQYSRPIRESYLELFVDESGLRFFSIDHPRRVQKIENENVALLPFPEVIERLKNTVAFGMYGGSEADPATPSVWRAVLTTYTTPVRSGDGYYEMPCWVFLFRPRGSDAFEEEEQITKEAILINAIDGSVILPARGY